jgi:hypothetical protein
MHRTFKVALEDADALLEAGHAFSDPGFQGTFARYPDSTVASPHLFQKVAAPGIRVDRSPTAAAWKLWPSWVITSVR